MASHTKLRSSSINFTWSSTHQISIPRISDPTDNTLRKRTRIEVAKHKEFIKIIWCQTNDSSGCATRFFRRFFQFARRGAQRDQEWREPLQSRIPGAMFSAEYRTLVPAEKMQVRSLLTHKMAHREGQT